MRMENNTILPVAVHPDKLQPFYDCNIFPLISPIPPTPPSYMTVPDKERIKDSALGSDLTNKITDSTNLPNMTAKQDTAKAMSQNTTDSLPKSLKQDTAQPTSQNHRP